MKFIQGNSRQQIQMLCLEDFISPENPVRFIDAFVHKIGAGEIGHPITKRYIFIFFYPYIVDF